MSEIWLATGEATVLAADGQYTDAMPEVMIGDVKGPVGHAFASMAGQVAGHPRMFVIRDLNQQVRPADDDDHQDDGEVGSLCRTAGRRGAGGDGRRDHRLRRGRDFAEGRG